MFNWNTFKIPIQANNLCIPELELEIIKSKKKQLKE